MKLPRALLATLLFASALHAQIETDEDHPRLVVFPSPDGKFAFLAVSQPEQEPQKTFDLIEKESSKVLLRVTESDQGKNRLQTEVFWTADSKRFALGAIYNHFGWNLTVYARSGETFRKIELPDLAVPDIPDRLTRGHEWKWTKMESQQIKGWRKDGSLAVRCESQLQAINSDLNFTAERTVVLGFGRSAKARILQSKRRVVRHETDD